ncbi:MAG: PAS domain S-box protein, partial [Candidatus Kryptoniota bacterium]
MLISLQDVTAQKQIQDFLTRDRKRLQSLLDILQTSESNPTALIPELLKQSLMLTGSRSAYWLETDLPDQLLRLQWYAETNFEDWIVQPRQQILEWKDDDFWTQPILQQKPIYWNELSAQPPFSEKNWVERIERLLIVPMFDDRQVKSLLAVANKAEPYDNGDISHIQILVETARQAAKKRRLEEKLAEQEKFYREMLENSNDLVYKISFVPQLHIEYISPSVQRITGFTGEQLSQDIQAVLRLIYPEDLPKLQQLLEGKWDTSESLLGRFFHRNGELRWAEQRITMLYDENGQLIGIQGIVRDVTERKKLEEAFERMVNEYDILFDSVQDTLFLIKVEEDGQFRYIRNNRIHQELTGISLETLRGKTPKELLGSELGALVQANYQRCVDAGEIIQYEETLDLPGGLRI